MSVVLAEPVTVSNRSGGRCYVPWGLGQISLPLDTAEVIRPALDLIQRIG